MSKAVDVSPAITPFLMFGGDAEEAINVYLSLFDGSEVISLHRYGPNEAGAKGSVQHAIFSLKGQLFRCMDSTTKHDFTFTPSLSLYVRCDSDAEIDRLCTALGEGGTELMPLADYGFSTKFAWLNDRFGVSWQLNLGGT